MFFKMLKNDLKRKKGLNVILFIFISVASILVFAGSVQIFSNFTREATAKRLCRTSDTQFWIQSEDYADEAERQKIADTLAAEPNVTGWSTSKIARISDTSIEYPHFDLKENRYMYMMKIQVLSPRPREHDLVYDLNDQPFYVPNGCIAIPIEVQSTVGVRKGDKVKFTKETGEVYELEVCCIFKDNMDNGTVRYIVSDSDYEVLSKNNIRSYASYSIQMKDGSDDRISELRESLNKRDIPVLSITFQRGMSDDVVMMEIISVLVVIISVFLILIIFMTIRFTMIADLKAEEKEIGMMKALVVYSFSFRWLFAAKYIAFAIIGGMIGIAAGLPIAGAFINMFGPDCILPERWQMILIGVLSVIVIIIVMIAFSLFVMRRISKISVIDAIHGENRGERFSKRFPMFLHRRKKMSVPFFIALTEILMRFKRYIFLLIAYSLGTVIILLGFNTRNSVITPRYTQYWLYHNFDFSLDLSDEQQEEVYKEMEKTGMRYLDVINKKLSDAGIPAHIDSMYAGECSLKTDKKYTYFDLYWKKGEPQKVNYRKGGTAPKLANEAAMSAYTASKLGISVGDVLKLVIRENNEDRTSYDENEREIVITGLVDYMEDGNPIIIMGDEYEDGYTWWSTYTGFTIDAPEKEKPAVIAQMKKLFGDEGVMDGTQALRKQVKEFDTLFILFEYVIGGAVVLVLMLITYLYMSIFVAEEVPETALLKSMGFRNISIKSLYLLRMMILLVISIALGELYLWTGGSVFFGSFMTQYKVTGMKLYFEFPVSFIIIPLIITAAVLFTTIINLRNIKHIGIWKISEE
ncbi:MAG: ABC transporter permease [Ruminococcus sp.]|nr:ABC transporter permease [Ruminococcus sp.]